MKDLLIGIAAVIAAFVAITSFVLASDDVTAQQEKLVKAGADHGDALEAARNSRKRKRLILVLVPAIVVVALNIWALVV